VTTAIIHAAIYLRISDADRDDFNAIWRQYEDACRVIERMGWALYADADTKHPEFAGAFVDHSLSASKRNVRRPAYERMLAAARSGVIGAVVCYNFDRLTRQPRQLSDWIDLAEDSGFRIKTLSEDYDLNTADGRLHARIKVDINASEVERKSERQKRANDQRAAEGKPMPVRRVYGFAEADDKTKGNTTPHPTEAGIVKRLFEEADADAKPNLWRMAEQLNREGVKMTTSPKTSARAGAWTPTTVRNVLTNPRYAGLIVSLTREERDTMSATALRNARRDRSRWVVAPNVKPIIKRDLFERVFTKLTDKTRATAPADKARKHFLTGVARCFLCGKTLICRRGNGQSYYVCPTSIGIDRQPGHTQISKAPVERGVALAVGFTLATRASDVLAALGAAQGIDSTAVAARLDAIDAEVAEVMTDRSAGLLTAAQSRPTLERLREERTKLEDDLAAAHRSNVSTAVLARMAKRYAADFADRQPAIGAAMWTTGTPSEECRADCSDTLGTAARIAADFLALDLAEKSSVVATLFNVTAHGSRREDGTRRTPDERLLVTDKLLAPARVLAA